ncbi:Ctr copper transporter family-domain-containing protein [Plectosphaerella plurivora]|uniref:Copper transport protein n=1 Tax=Plectosphaerella plurivora TaxID=936078 RepID=A0A9P8VGR6_9PEZI|nr:Ctr copper transporter family-domain-containing protein [Plectosphaerella plurivora]
MDHGTAETAECKVSMLWNWNTVDACFLSSSWQILNNRMMVASCIGVALLVVVLEVLRHAIRLYDAKIIEQMQRRGAAVLASSAASRMTDDGTPEFDKNVGLSLPRRKIVMRVSPLQQILRAFLYAVTFGVAYVVMMLAMYLNGYIFISIVVGAGLGNLLALSQPPSLPPTADMPSATTMSSVATSTSTNIQSGTGPAPVDMAQPACSCYCGCQIVVRFPGGNLCEFCNENHNDG